MAKDKASPHKKRNCLILEWRKLPEALKKDVADRERFGNDILLKMHSEFKPRELSEAALRSYYDGQVARTDEYATFRGSYEEFIEEYGLQMEVWLVEQGFDLADVDEVLINVSW